MKALRGLEKFSGGWLRRLYAGLRRLSGGPQSDYSVCPRPLRRVFSFSGFRFLGFQVSRFSGFSGFLGRDAELDPEALRLVPTL